MSHKKIFLFIIVLSFLYVYMTNIDKIPSRITLFQNEDYEISHLKGINIDGEKLSSGNNFFNNFTKINSEKVGKSNLKLSAFGGFFNKDIEVSVLPETKVIIGGHTVGIRLYSKGVLVIGKAPVQGLNGEWYEPYENTKIEKGAKILKINDKPIESIVELVEVVSSQNDEDILRIQYEQDGNFYEEEMNPIISLDDGRKKLGLWVRDGAMGVGTLTFYEPSTNKVAALGHGISDQDIKKLIDLDKGDLNLASVISIKKGMKNSPGEIKGLLNERVSIGAIELNNECGIYGTYEDDYELLKKGKEILVASKNEIEEGPAKIYCAIEEDGIPREYEINIIRVSDAIGAKSKGMIIEVTDEELLQKTGGIIQGMSGSPIVQNNKFIGAVTHVYVNDPTRGYAIFGETMLEQINILEKEEV